MTLEVYRGKSALGDTEGAKSAKAWADKVNTAIGGIGDNRTSQLKNTLDTIEQKASAAPFQFKQTQAPFQYSAQADPSYQAAFEKCKGTRKWLLVILPLI